MNIPISWICLNVHVTGQCGAVKKLDEHDKVQKVTQFLMGLNDNYTSIRGQILMMTPLPELSQVYALLIQEEKQRECSFMGSVADSTATTALLAKSGSYKPYLKPGSVSSDSLTGTSSNSGVKRIPKKNLLFCNYCKGNNHVKENCFKLIGYPEWYKGNKMSAASINATFHADSALPVHNSDLPIHVSSIATQANRSGGVSSLSTNGLTPQEVDQVRKYLKGDKTALLADLFL